MLPNWGGAEIDLALGKGDNCTWVSVSNLVTSGVVFEVPVDFTKNQLIIVNFLQLGISSNNTYGTTSSSNICPFLIINGEVAYFPWTPSRGGGACMAGADYKPSQTNTNPTTFKVTSTNPIRFKEKTSNSIKCDISGISTITSPLTYTRVLGAFIYDLTP